MQKEQHITDKELRILHCLYEQKTNHVRSLQKTTQLSEHTLLKYLKTLEIRKMLASKKQGNLKLFQVNLQTPLVKLFFAYFDLQRSEKIEYKRKRTFEEFIKKIKTIKLPYFVLLFGSTAKGKYTPTSDIDLILLYDEYDKDIRTQIENLIRDLYAETGLHINLILMKLEEFLKEKNNKENYALQDALQTGYPVFGNTLYYEAVFP